MARASKTKKRMEWRIDRFLLGRKHEMLKIVGRMPVQVKMPRQIDWMPRRRGGFLLTKVLQKGRLPGRRRRIKLRGDCHEYVQRDTEL